MRFFNRFSRRTRLALLVIAVPLLVGVAAFGYWTLAPLFYDVRVSEALAGAGAQPAELRQGAFRDADAFHKAAGTARVVRTDEGPVLRFEEDFQTTNGPDLFVWLVKGGDVDNGYVDLGRLKGNVGSQNYAIPEGTDLDAYDQVFIWCKAFSVLFGSAELAQL